MFLLLLFLNSGLENGFSSSIFLVTQSLSPVQKVRLRDSEERFSKLGYYKELTQTANVFWIIIIINLLILRTIPWW